VAGKSPMKIRFLTAADAAAYWNIRLDALECDPEAFGASAEEHRTITVEDIATRLSDDPANNFVVGAFDGEQLVGTAGFYRSKRIKERHKGHIWGVYVSRKERGEGTAREMLQVLLDRAIRTEGIEQIMLAVATTQDAACKLYRSLGFETFGLEKRALKVGDRYIDEQHMALYLGSTSPR
jgi:ribosomal protein S18 acetylase RimI-like enzyme